MTPEARRLALQLFLTQQKVVMPFVVPATYLIARLMGLAGDQVLWMLTVPLPVLAVLFIAGLPLVLFRRETARALATPGAGGERFARLVELGPKLEWVGLGTYLLTASTLSAAASLRYDVPFLPVLPALVLVAAFERLVALRQAVAVEALLMPHLLRAHEEGGGRLPPGNRWLRPTLETRLRFTVLASGLSLMLSVGAIVVTELRDAIARHRADTRIDLDDLRNEVLGEAALPLLLIGGFVVVMSGLATRGQSRALAARLEEVSGLVRDLAQGRPRRPSWVGADETGRLSDSLAAVADSTKGAASSLRDATRSLGAATDDLTVSSEEQQHSVHATMTALRETEVTAQEIRQTSLLALQKAKDIEAAVAEAEQAAARGRAAIAENAAGLEHIAASVADTARRTRALGEWARRIDGIALSVKELAAQSNVLALNAGIEAVRAGAQGRSFGVVAREIRTLADQSAAAAVEVRALIEQVSAAIDEVALRGEEGLAIVEQAKAQADQSQRGLEALTGSVQQNAAAVRQVLAAVSQQSAGIGQIFEALRELSAQAEATVERVARSAQAADRLRAAGDEVEHVLRALDREAA